MLLQQKNAVPGRRPVTAGTAPPHPDGPLRVVLSHRRVVLAGSLALLALVVALALLAGVDLD